ncbi:YktB family protein [Paenisporosarcina cavernae]|uniref:UPF0637 protein D3873_04170 n=1 Tax=Paenisporosarcina cavernae TaxID=2320858 RepID=A0A385YU69_9BACL|nr:DUF1054 domain-containing protein [Paenisporosarcina cavernae]AYC29112.1 DUF1054 domain-containing protein [Paenisporosarcina cavernae]
MIPAFTKSDFEVFEVDGLEQRMQALTEIVRPKFQQFGDRYKTYFTESFGNEFHVHIAKHLRRTVNPPKDSWVALAPNKRGYKAIPHFQIGLWGSHAFIILAVIYEAKDKSLMAERLLKKLPTLKKLPADFVVSGDHMSPEGVTLKDAKKEILESLLVRLRDVKKGEFVIGRHIPREEAITMSDEEFAKLIEETFEKLLPVYNILNGVK